MVRLRDSWPFSLSSAPTAGNPCRPLQPESVLPVQLAARHNAEATGLHDQSALGVRASPSAAQGGARARPLRGPLLAGAASARADDADGISVLAGSAPPRRQAGEKGRPAGHLRNPASPASGACCLINSLTSCTCDVRTVWPTSHEAL